MNSVAHLTRKSSKNFFAPIALTLTLALTVLAPMISVIHGHMLLFACGLCVLLSLIAAICKSWHDTIFTLMLAADFSAVWYFWGGADFGLADTAIDQRTLAIRTFSITAFTLLNLVLLIGPWSRFSRLVEKLYGFRRHLGVSAFLLGLAHFALLFGPYFDYSFANAFLGFYTFFGFTALLIMFFMAVTSWNWVQKNITTRQWKIFHAATLAIYLPIMAYAIWVNLAQNLQIETWQYILLGLFILFWLAVAPFGPIVKIMRNVRGWKQFHVLIYVAYVSLIVHSWIAFFSAQILPVQVVHIALIAFVLISHLAGWIVKFRQDRTLRAQEASAESIKINGFEYRSVGKIEDFKEGIGRRVLVGGIPVAIFRIKEKFYAWLAVCPHQKGPLERGQIIDGYLTCPWHKWQYSTVDGSGPPGYLDCVNLYPTHLQNGKLFVSRVPVPKKAPNPVL